MLKIQSTVLIMLLLSSGLVNATSPKQRPIGYYQCNVTNVSNSDITKELISLSEFILEGTIISPTELIQSNLKSNKHDYVTSSLVHVKNLKGKIKDKKIFIKHFSQENPDDVCIKSLIEKNRTKVVVFLVKPDKLKEEYFYFAGHTPNSLTRSTNEKVAHIKKIISEQERILNNFDRFKYLNNRRIYRKVQNLINKSLEPKLQQDSFDKITKLGIEAVPSIILLMEDYRKLPNRETMSPNYLHYGPKVVVDELSTILSYLTGKHLGRIYSGGSARERKQAIDAWKLYLVRGN